MSVKEMMSTAAVALAFTKSEENSAIDSTVAWVMATLDVCLGWTAPKAQGMDRKTAIKTMRESHGYRLDSEGKAIVIKGQRAKRSAVFNRLALVDKVIGYMVKAMPGRVTDLHVVAISGDSDRMESMIQTIAADLCLLSGDDTLDALAFFLDNGKANAIAEPVKDAVAELTAQGSAESVRPDNAALPAKPDSSVATFGDVLAYVLQFKGQFSDAQLTQLSDMCAAELVQRLANDAKEAAELQNMDIAA